MCTVFVSGCFLSGINCTSEIAVPRNGYITVEDYHYEGIVSYICDSGYEVSGSAVRQCQSNGLWSGAPPRCIGMFIKIAFCCFIVLCIVYTWSLYYLEFD